MMACGTGKTYMSVKIAEDLVPPGGSVLFLVLSVCRYRSRCGSGRRRRRCHCERSRSAST